LQDVCFFGDPWARLTTFPASSSSACSQVHKFFDASIRRRPLFPPLLPKLGLLTAPSHSPRCVWRFSSASPNNLLFPLADPLNLRTIVLFLRAPFSRYRGFSQVFFSPSQGSFLACAASGLPTRRFSHLPARSLMSWGLPHVDAHSRTRLLGRLLTPFLSPGLGTIPVAAHPSSLFGPGPMALLDLCATSLRS